MSTDMPGFSHVPGLLHHFVMAKLCTIRVKRVKNDKG